jgi:hypothetical protein
VENRLILPRLKPCIRQADASMTFLLAKACIRRDRLNCRRLRFDDPSLFTANSSSETEELREKFVNLERVAFQFASALFIFHCEK